jgi:branched-chain amino acid transport system substrate-binding protein
MKKLCLILSVVFVMNASGAIAAEPVRLGFIYILSGRTAHIGAIAEQGAKIAIDEINRKGGINGRRVVAIFKDSKGKPDVAGVVARKLVTEDKVDAVIGVIYSSVAPRVSEVMKELSTPFIITTAVTPIVTGKKCNRYTFRVTGSANMIMKATALLAKKTGAKKWTTIGPDYSLGPSSWKLFKKYLGEASPDVEFLPQSEALFVPTTTTDWTKYIRKLMTSSSDGVLVSIWGGNYIDFTRQAKKLGFFDGTRTTVMPVVTISDVVALGLECPIGVWNASAYWPLANPGGYDKEFVAAYAAKTKVLPGHTAQCAYAGVKVYAEAAALAGSTDKETIVKALEGLTINLPVGKLTIRPEDHQAMFDYIGGRTSNKIGLTPRRSVYRLLESVSVFKGSEVVVPIDQTGCNMK